MLALFFMKSVLVDPNRDAVAALVGGQTAQRGDGADEPPNFANDEA